MRDRGTAPGSRGCPRRSGSEKPEGAAAAAGGGAAKCPSFSPSRAAPRPPQPRGAQPAPPHSALAHHVPVDPALGAAGAAGSGRCGAVPGWPAAWLPSPAQRQEQVSGSERPGSLRAPPETRRCTLGPLGRPPRAPRSRSSGWRGAGAGRPRAEQCWDVGAQGVWGRAERAGRHSQASQAPWLLRGFPLAFFG